MQGYQHAGKRAVTRLCRPRPRAEGPGGYADPGPEGPGVADETSFHKL